MFHAGLYLFLGRLLLMNHETVTCFRFKPIAVELIAALALSRFFRLVLQIVIRRRRRRSIGTHKKKKNVGKPDMSFCLGKVHWIQSKWSHKSTAVKSTRHSLIALITPIFSQWKIFPYLFARFSLLFKKKKNLLVALYNLQVVKLFVPHLKCTVNFLMRGEGVKRLKLCVHFDK